MNEGDNGTVIVVVGNGSAMQPCMQGRPRFRDGHEQPHHQRHHGRCGVKALPPRAIDWTRPVLQTVCNLAHGVPLARYIWGLVITVPGLGLGTALVVLVVRMSRTRRYMVLAGVGYFYWSSLSSEEQVRLQRGSQ